MDRNQTCTDQTQKEADDSMPSIPFPEKLLSVLPPRRVLDSQSAAATSTDGVSNANIASCVCVFADIPDLDFRPSFTTNHPDFGSGCS